VLQVFYMMVSGSVVSGSVVSSREVMLWIILKHGR
jgi:hypothetical protein